MTSATLALVLLIQTPEPSPLPDAQAAVESALAYLQSESLDWIQIHRCATCHHAPMAIWALREAKSRGFSVDDAALDQLERFTLDDPEAGKLLPADRTIKPDAPPPGSISAAYAALALRAVPEAQRSDAARALEPELQAYLLATQDDDGLWTQDGGRPPILEDRLVTSVISVLALDPSTEPAREAITRWAAASTAEASPRQSDSLRLLLAARLQSLATTAEKAEWIERIIARQNHDGGWSQSPDRPSDAFATGQNLYILVEAGAALDRPEIIRAREYLVQTQADDGSWSIDSRPTEPGGEGAKDLRPITAAASAWATLGLVRSTQAPTP